MTDLEPFRFDNCEPQQAVLQAQLISRRVALPPRPTTTFHQYSSVSASSSSKTKGMGKMLGHLA